jgi:hypothetical protein
MIDPEQVKHLPEIVRSNLPTGWEYILILVPTGEATLGDIQFAFNCDLNTADNALQFVADNI